MGNLDCRPNGDEQLVLLTRASLVNEPHIPPANRGKRDAWVPVEAYFASPQSEVIEFLRIRSGPDSQPTDLYFAPRTPTGEPSPSCPGYYEVGTNRLFIDQPITRSDLALYEVGDLRRVGVLV